MFKKKFTVKRSQKEKMNLKMLYLCLKMRLFLKIGIGIRN